MNISKTIDHTVLKTFTQKKDIERFCLEAKENNFASVCINPCWISYAKELLKDTDVKVCTVIGFPIGANDTKVKAYEASVAIANGAEEVDMVINVGKLKDRELSYVEEDIKSVVKEAKEKALVKVIIETCLLTEEEKEIACRLAVKAGADFVKTSTGFSTGGATVEDIKLMKFIVGDKAKVKASTGINSLEDVKKMMEVGATRFGTSKGVRILKEYKREE
ncbi:deoxyribose-phosphate aldolase [Clostridium oceanicum]|uniref:Deoxyribose-phosphate aldolase n=1 Tax=Clostridium oceanicum TaxID=1543 RepID=A0ABP3UJG1_9CLOT